MATRDSSHTIQEERRYEARSAERFNRVEYAMHLLKLLNPPLRVAVYSNYRQVKVEQGRGIGAEGPWALFGVPPHATRESIARALAELTGREQQPFLVDLLCAVPADPAG